VGYKSPPKQQRWKKGQSGNPSGKKKASKLKVQLLLTSLASKLAGPMEITMNGNKIKMAFGEAFALKMLHQAMERH
jgi:hypothetical protein